MISGNLIQLERNLLTAGSMNKFVGKQIMLIMCGKSYQSMDRIREMLLSFGVRRVWTPDYQLSKMEAKVLFEGMQKQATFKESRLDILMERTLIDWMSIQPDSPAIKYLNGNSWVFLGPVAIVTGFV